MKPCLVFTGLLLVCFSMNACVVKPEDLSTLVKEHMFHPEAQVSSFIDQVPLRFSGSGKNAKFLFYQDSAHYRIFNNHSFASRDSNLIEFIDANQRWLPESSSVKSIFYISGITPDERPPFELSMIILSTVDSTYVIHSQDERPVKLRTIPAGDVPELHSIHNCSSIYDFSYDMPVFYLSVWEASLGSNRVIVDILPGRMENLTMLRNANHSEEAVALNSMLYSFIDSLIVLAH